MKKLLSILCIAVIAFTASSCKKETIVAPNNNQTILVNLRSQDWVTTDNGKNYTQIIDVPELDSYLTDHAGVLVYLTINDGVYEQVPEVYQGVSYSYTYSQGTVVLYAQSYDGAQTTPVPPNAIAKIVLVDSN
ncbi:hypothetical protein [Mucilaginibacter segetis]|uniref:DUF4377 domain-containing protein n=1 Tax=Mucilaginibacter segetis TaxID=2793071 RepID=A0A934PQL9_9SPHI|nr:hypothetical protein [Mucilaginibacter segetis]MBK0377882.1 hypothetical protein [Mucilaginibacter segetis]